MRYIIYCVTLEIKAINLCFLSFSLILQVFKQNYRELLFLFNFQVFHLLIVKVEKVEKNYYTFCG